MELIDYLEYRDFSVAPFTGTDSIIPALLKDKYIVVKNADRYEGLLTIKDLVENYHNLVIDCLREKPVVFQDQDIDSVIETMHHTGFRALPVFSRTKQFIGVITYEAIISLVCSLVHHHIEVKNIVRDNETENMKSSLLAELSHHTKNPVQVILASVELLMKKADNLDDRLLLKTIEEATRIIDEVLTKVFEKYFL
jgi:signal transduction histidine kinase